MIDQLKKKIKAEHKMKNQKRQVQQEESSPPAEATGQIEKRTRLPKKKFDYEQNARTIFVGNLSNKLDHKDVAKLFKSCGPVESARIRSVVAEKEKLAPKVALITNRLHPKVDSVNAYVVFKTNGYEESVKKALEMNGRLIEGHHIRVDTAQRPKTKRQTLTSRKKSIFVGNLRFDCRDEDLINHFEKKIGSVSHVRMVRDRATGLGKGFGFVVFNERAAVKKALELNDSDFKGRQLRIKKVEEENDGKTKNKPKPKQQIVEKIENDKDSEPDEEHCMDDVKVVKQERKPGWKRTDKKVINKPMRKEKVRKFKPKDEAGIKKVMSIKIQNKMKSKGGGGGGRGGKFDKNKNNRSKTMKKIKQPRKGGGKGGKVRR